MSRSPISARSLHSSVYPSSVDRKQRLRSVAGLGSAALSMAVLPIAALSIAVLSIACSDGDSGSPASSGTPDDGPSGGETNAQGTAGNLSDGAAGAEGGDTNGGAPNDNMGLGGNQSGAPGGTGPAYAGASTGGADGEPAGSAGVPNTAGSAPDSAGTSAGGNAGDDGNAAGTAGADGQDPDNVAPNAVYAAPNGSPGADGSLDAPLPLAEAVATASAGDTVYLRGGQYALDATIRLAGDGSEALPINLRAYPLDEERPHLDFSAMPENSSNRGFILSGDYWHVYGLDISGAGDNCMFVSGSHNTIEFSTFSECADTGLQLGNGASENLVLNCDSYFNADSSLENADGFAAKLDVGTGNRFVGSRAWNNLDDGWDGYLRPATNITTTYENCWAIDNGKLKNGSVGAGDGNGFKTGGSDDKNLAHHAIYRQCIAAGNVHDGFDHNSNRGEVTIINSAAHNNGSNINFSTSNIAAALTIKNTVSLGTNGSLSATRTDIANNSWQNGLSATNDDFVSVDVSQLKAPRKSDGSLPDIDYLKLTPGSDLRNAGVDVGLPFAGSAPDLGPFESDQ